MPLIQRNIKLQSEDLEWFEETYPHTSLSGVLGLLLSKFRESHTITPKDLINNAIDKFREEMG